MPVKRIRNKSSLDGKGAKLETTTFEPKWPRVRGEDVVVDVSLMFLYPVNLIAMIDDFQ
jgi:hypothetical protein